MSDDDQTKKDFDEAVNMTASELKKWLDTDESKSVGQKKDGGESTARERAAHRAHPREKRADLTDDDYAHMRKVVGYVKRHSAQKPKGDITDTDWRYSLMNWGNDPKK